MKYFSNIARPACIIILVWLAMILGNVTFAQISITNLPYNPPVTNFDTYNPSSAMNLLITIPTGWTASSSGTPAHMGQGNGSSATGGYWAYGAQHRENIR